MHIAHRYTRATFKHKETTNAHHICDAKKPNTVTLATVGKTTLKPFASPVALASAVVAGPEDADVVDSTADDTATMQRNCFKICIILLKDTMLMER